MRIKPKRLGTSQHSILVPTVLRFDGLRVVIYPNDHRPAHVHVIGAGGEAVFFLSCPGGPPELRESHRFSVREANRIDRAVESARAFVQGMEVDPWPLLNVPWNGP